MTSQPQCGALLLVLPLRCIYADKLAYLIEAGAAGVKMEDEGAFDTYKVRLRLAQADSARSQDNFIVALKQLSQTHNVRQRFTLLLKFSCVCVDQEVCNFKSQTGRP